MASMICDKYNLTARISNKETAASCCFVLYTLKQPRQSPNSQCRLLWNADSLHIFCSLLTPQPCPPFRCTLPTAFTSSSASGGVVFTSLQTLFDNIPLTGGTHEIKQHKPFHISANKHFCQVQKACVPHLSVWWSLSWQHWSFARAAPLRCFHTTVSECAITHYHVVPTLHLKGKD